MSRSFASRLRRRKISTPPKLDLEKKLKRSERELARVKNEFQDFVYSIAHELSGPMRQASGFAEMILRNNEATLDEKTKKHLNIILSSALNGRQSLEALRNFSSTLNLDLAFQKDVNLKNCVDEAIVKLEFENIYHDVDINVQELPCLTCDPESITQLFYELLKNALIFKGEKQKAIISIKAAQTVNKQAWEISVQDKGIGIIPHRIEDIFKPFKRCHSRHEYAGDGLGLTIAKSIVKSHYGDIWIDESYVSGTQIIFTLWNDPLDLI